MCVLRRLLLLWLFMFWQGGFFFYAAVVVSVGNSVLGSHFDQGMITRHVTNWLNLAGAVVLGAWIADLVMERRYYPRWRWALWIFLVATLIALACLHPYMDEHIDVAQSRLLDRHTFRSMHRWYLHLSTAQWLASMALTYFTLQNWRRSDRTPETP